jgi:hypothetical protein
MVPNPLILKFRHLAFLLAFFALLACEDNTDCSSLTRNLVKVRLESESSPPPLLLYEGIYPKTRPDSLITGTPLYNTLYEFAVNPGEPSTTYYFEGPGILDSLTLGYTVQYAVISELCGVEVLYQDLQVLAHTFDSVAIISPSFNRLTELNLEIYF